MTRSHGPIGVRAQKRNFRNSTRRVGENAPPKRTSSRADEMQISMSRDNFFANLRSENREDRNLHLDLRGFTLTVRTPQCDTLFGE